MYHQYNPLVPPPLYFDNFAIELGPLGQHAPLLKGQEVETLCEGHCCTKGTASTGREHFYTAEVVEFRSFRRILHSMQKWMSIALRVEGQNHHLLRTRSNQNHSLKGRGGGWGRRGRGWKEWLFVEYFEVYEFVDAGWDQCWVLEHICQLSLL